MIYIYHNLYYNVNCQSFKPIFHQTFSGRVGADKVIYFGVGTFWVKMLSCPTEKENLLFIFI